MNLFEDAIDCLSKYKDITNLISIIQQIELLKTLLFSKEQLDIFTFISKPTFSKVFVENNSFSEAPKYEFENSIVEYFKSRQNTNKLDEIDMKLYENLNNFMKERIKSTKLLKSTIN